MAEKLTPLQRWIRTRRDEGALIRDIAEELGVREITVQFYQTKKRRPGKAVLSQIMKATGLSFMELLQ